jgi:hypothetical protein
VRINCVDFDNVVKGSPVRGGRAVDAPHFDLVRWDWVVDIRTTTGVVLTKTLAEAWIKEPPAVTADEVVEGTPLACGYAAGPVRTFLGNAAVVFVQTSPNDNLPVCRALETAGVTA